MPSFRSYDDILRHFNKNPITSQQISGMKGYSSGADSMKRMLEREANLLAQCIQEALDEYYASYEPKVYERREYRGHPNPLRKGIKVNPVKVIYSGGSKKYSVAINFAEDNAMHPSIFNGEPGFVPNLLNYGWSWKTRTGPYRLAYYEGSHFVEKGIEKYYQRSSTKLSIKIEVVYQGRKIVDKEFNPPE